MPDQPKGALEGEGEQLVEHRAGGGAVTGGPLHACPDHWSGRVGWVSTVVRRCPWTVVRATLSSAAISATVWLPASYSAWACAACLVFNAAAAPAGPGRREPVAGVGHDQLPLELSPAPPASRTSRGPPRWRYRCPARAPAAHPAAAEQLTELNQVQHQPAQPVEPSAHQHVAVAHRAEQRVELRPRRLRPDTRSRYTASGATPALASASS